MQLFLMLLVVLSLSLLTGCPASKSSEVYTRNQTRQAQVVEIGTVQYTKPILIEGTKSPVGTLGGTAIGGIAGSTVGGGRGSGVAAVVGGILGGIAGAAIEEGVTRQNGLEITIKLDSGQTVAVVQADDISFRPGERVRVLTSPSAVRVVR